MSAMSQMKHARPLRRAAKQLARCSLPGLSAEQANISGSVPPTATHGSPQSHSSSQMDCWHSFEQRVHLKSEQLARPVTVQQSSVTFWPHEQHAGNSNQNPQKEQQQAVSRINSVVEGKMGSNAASGLASWTASTASATLDL